MKLLQAAALLVALAFASFAHAQVGPKVGNIAWMSVGDWTDFIKVQVIGSNGLYSNGSHGCGTAYTSYQWVIQKSSANFDVFFAQLIEAAASGREVQMYGSEIMGTGWCSISYISVH
jgi:hypothetical protein